ncbi:MAG: HisA/HisF-related TIM barrel protein [Oscillochloridaceae bacterium]|nr:HisA/HisF-related TIM barrel protein [Chloroflexaceae bacterium]MDW8388750.1 HisA/HisF-related TIM barrel protein [Oscillochloridaceae bacterium]
MIDLAPRNPYALELATPLLAAAGSLGYGVEVGRLLRLGQRDGGHGLGALITRSTSLRPRRARPASTLVETPAGLLYASGAPNPGLRAVRQRFALIWAAWETPVILSVTAADEAELGALLAELEMIEGVRGVELPLPTLGATEPATAARLVAAARAATPLPLIVKLPVYVEDLAELAAASAAAGADALNLSVGPPGAAIVAGRRVEGRLCGPALRPLGLRAVARVAGTVDVPLIGGGGVMRAADARALLDAGAAAVALGSALLTDLRAAGRIMADLSPRQGANPSGPG